MDFRAVVTASEVVTHFELEERLSAAVAAAVEVAMRDKKRGVLVTRHDGRHFTVELSLDVPVRNDLRNGREFAWERARIALFRSSWHFNP
jgi:hypothetical protein